MKNLAQEEVGGKVEKVSLNQSEHKKGNFCLLDSYWCLALRLAHFIYYLKDWLGMVSHSHVQRGRNKLSEGHMFNVEKSHILNYITDSNPPYDVTSNKTLNKFRFLLFEGGNISLMFLRRTIFCHDQNLHCFGMMTLGGNWHIPVERRQDDKICSWRNGWGHELNVRTLLFIINWSLGFL